MVHKQQGALDLEVQQWNTKLSKSLEGLRKDLQKENHSAEAQKKEFLAAVTRKMQQIDSVVQDFSHKTQERITKSLLEDANPDDSILSASSSPLEQPFLDKLHSTPKPGGPAREHLRDHRAPGAD